MPVQTFLVMRHAEKTEDPQDPDLSDAGAERARRLADWVPPEFGAPDFIVATAPSKHSLRPIQTVKPLAKKLEIDIGRLGRPGVWRLGQETLIEEAFSKQSHAGVLASREHS